MNENNTPTQSSQLSEKKYNKETVNEDLFMLSELRQTLI